MMSTLEADSNGKTASSLLFTNRCSHQSYRPLVWPEQLSQIIFWHLLQHLHHQHHHDRSLLKGNGWEKQISATDTWQAAWKFWDLWKYFFDLKYELRSYADLHFEKVLMSNLERWQVKKLTKTFSHWKKFEVVFFFRSMGACLQSITCIRWAAAITQLRFITQSELLTQSPAADQDILRTNHYCHWCESKESWQLLGTILRFILSYIYIKQYYLLLFRFPTGLFWTKNESWKMCRVKPVKMRNDAGYPAWSHFEQNYQKYLEKMFCSSSNAFK